VKTLSLCKAMLLAGVTLAAPVLAQTAPGNDARTTGSTEPQTAAPTDTAPDVADIVVTAQRRPERLQNVPISVTAVSSDTLKTRALNDLSSLAQVAPSLQTGNDNTFAVRGVGTLAFSQSLESSVAFAQDEVNLTNSNLVTDLFDVAQVEVLNGPQGLLFGKNASAGLLNVTTTRPQLGHYGADFDLEGDYRDKAPGNSDGAIVRANVNLPIGERSALRVNAFYNYQSPVVQFVGPASGRVDLGQRRFAFRGKYLWQPSDAFSLYVIGEYGEEHGALGLFGSTFRSLGAGSVNVGPQSALGITPGPDNLQLGGDAGYFRDVSRHGLQGKMTYTLDNGIEISDIAAWKGFRRNQQIDQDFSAQDGANVNAARTKFDQYSNELRVALPAGDRLSGQAGLYYFHADLAVQNQIAGNNFLPAFVLPTYPFCVGATAVAGARPPVCSVSNSFFLGNDHNITQKTDSYAAFGQLTYRIVDGLQVIAGGRVTHDDISIDLVQNTGRYFVPLGIPFSGSQSYKNTDFSWKAGLQYNFTPNAMAYGTYARGYKGPGFNDNAVSQTGSLVVRPEINRNIEAGVKTTWFNRRLLFNVSLFRSHFSDYQVQSIDLTTNAFVTQNAAKLHNKGAEITATVTPVRGLTLNGSATVLDAEFKDFAGAQCYPTQGCTNGTFNASGLRPPLSPKFTSTGQAVYETAITPDGMRGFIEGNWYHRSAVQYNIAQSPGTRFGSVDLWGGSIGVRGDAWRFSVFCKNCTDRRVPTAIQVENGDAFAGVTSYYQQFGLNSFRTIGLQFGLHY